MRRWPVRLPTGALPGMATTSWFKEASVSGYRHACGLEYRKEMATEISFLGYDRFRPLGTLARGL